MIRELLGQAVGRLRLEDTPYWLELLVEGELLPADQLRSLQQETAELTAILVPCVKKAKGD
jgi:hypothetical protein